MKKSEIKELVKSAIEGIKLINAYFRFDANYYNLIPLNSNDKLFLAIKEYDFIFDGYSVFRYKDLKKVKIKNDLCDKILQEEGLTPNIVIPNIDISSWKSVFESLRNFNRNIIVEKRAIDDKDWEFVIGRIDKTYKNFAYLWHFDANGAWEGSPLKVPFSEVTNVTFGSRYVDIFSKYINDPPMSK
ncbi:hypothetical protein DP73_20400 [Desulfosporosinus sp. HMP52]|uniref:hypothetical protein n=1 Tax=Desulfosporosinus sp. HMP52 TaxID=1487923 RepID=UPI00051FA3DA|nr:hypothetical protein [Desulfosporosinus sp. HMP52]KGK82719.1 hypothetical protein DP73_20400 [Desulfosporosinus sp. HMP52]